MYVRPKKMERAVLLSSPSPSLHVKNAFGETAMGLAAAKNHGAVVRLLPGGTHNWEGRNAKGVPCVKCAKVVGVGREGCWCGRRLETQLDSIPTQPTATRTSYRGLYHWEGFAADAPIEVR